MRKRIAKKKNYTGLLTTADRLEIARGQGRLTRQAFKHITGKTIFEMKKQKQIVPLAEVAGKLGLNYLLPRIKNKMKILRVGLSGYVTAGELKRITTEYGTSQNAPGTAQSPKPKAKTREKHDRVQITRETTPGQEAKRKINPWNTLTGREAIWWVKNVLPHVGNARKRKRMRKLINENLHLSLAEFKKEVVSKIDDMLKDKKKT